MNQIQMVDTKTQYHKIKEKIDVAVIGVMESSRFIGGQVVTDFATNLAKYHNSKHVIPCANGTDALQIAMMALGLKAGDEVIKKLVRRRLINMCIYFYPRRRV